MRKPHPQLISGAQPRFFLTNSEHCEQHPARQAEGTPGLSPGRSPCGHFRADKKNKPPVVLFQQLLLICPEQEIPVPGVCIDPPIRYAGKLWPVSACLL